MGVDQNVLDGDDDLADTATSELPEPKPCLNDPPTDDLPKDLSQTETECDKPPEWVEWRESSDLGESADPTSNLDVASDGRVRPPFLPNGELQVESEVLVDEVGPISADADKSMDANKAEVGEPRELSDVNSGSTSEPSESGDGNPSSHNADSFNTEKPPITTEESSRGSESKE